MTTTSATDRAKEVASKTTVLVSRIVFAALVLVVFLGLAFLTWQGRLDGESVVLFAGFIVGYVAKGVREKL